VNSGSRVSIKLKGKSGPKDTGKAALDQFTLLEEPKKEEAEEATTQ